MRPPSTQGAAAPDEDLGVPPQHRRPSPSHSGPYSETGGGQTLVSDLRDTLRVIRRHSSSLANQLTRALDSVALNLAEGRRRTGRDRKHLYSIACGSADEVRVALRLAMAYGYVGEEALHDAFAKLDQVLAMTWTLSRK